MGMMNAGVRTVARLARPTSSVNWIRAAGVGARKFAAAAGLKETLIHAEHEADGGVMVDFAGYSMPVQYKGANNVHALSIIESVKWTRSSASLFDVSHMCSVRWTGKDAIAFVERVTTADVQAFPPMKGGLSTILNERGGIIDDTMLTKCHSEEHGDHIYQVINAGCAPKDIAHFERELAKFGGDVKMDVLWDSRGLYALQGPKAVDVIKRLSPSTDLSGVSFGQCFWAPLEGVKCLLWRCGYTGEDGFEIFVPGEQAAPLWRTLRDQPEVRLAALGARDALRLEAGLCLYGHDIDENTTPPEAGLTWVIGKGRRDVNAKNPFIGSERVLSQINNKKLYTRLRAGMFTKGPPAREGTIVETVDGEKVGVVTSGTMSPCLKRNVSIAMIDKPFNKKGTDLKVVVRGKKYDAQVTGMPFVPTNYVK